MLIGTNADETRYWIGEMGSWSAYRCAAPVLVRSIIHGFRKEDRARANAFLVLQKGSPAHRATDFFNELVFRVPSIVQAASHSENGGNTYMYYWTKQSAIPHFGACHAVELAYVFGNLGETIYTGQRAGKRKVLQFRVYKQIDQDRTCHKEKGDLKQQAGFSLFLQ